MAVSQEWLRLVSQKFREAANTLAIAREEHAEDWLRFRIADPKATDNQARQKADLKNIARLTRLEAEYEIAKAQMRSAE